MGFLARQVRKDVVSIEVNLESLTAGCRCPPFQELFLHVWIAGGGEECGKPIEAGYNLVGPNICLDVTGPTNYRRHTESAFPVRIFLTAKRSHGCVGPAEHVRAVVGGINHDGV